MAEVGQLARLSLELNLLTSLLLGPHEERPEEGLNYSQAYFPKVLGQSWAFFPPVGNLLKRDIVGGYE